MVQSAIPDRDVAIGAWTDELGGTTDLFMHVDNYPPGVPEDLSEYIVSESGPAASTCEIGLSPVQDPGTDAGHELRYRVRRDTGGLGSADYVIRLKQGATVIASQSDTNIGTGYLPRTLVLTPAEAASITDYGDLRFEVQADNRKIQCRWARLLVPDPPDYAVTQELVDVRVRDVMRSA